MLLHRIHREVSCERRTRIMQGVFRQGGAQKGGHSGCTCAAALTPRCPGGTMDQKTEGPLLSDGN